MSAIQKLIPHTRDMSGANNPCYGKPKSEAWKQHHREWMLKNNPFRGKHHSEKSRDVLSSKAAIRLIARPELSSGHHHFKTGYFVSAKAGKSLFHGSSYELRAFEMLEADPSVVVYDRGHFALPYMDNGKQHRYLPDIFVTYQDGHQAVIEIKPEYYVEDATNSAKAAVARPYCAVHNFEYIIWTEVDLSLPIQRYIRKEKART